jgi:hypothetical protein
VILLFLASFDFRLFFLLTPERLILLALDRGGPFSHLGFALCGFGIPLLSLGGAVQCLQAMFEAAGFDFKTFRATLGIPQGLFGIVEAAGDKKFFPAGLLGDGMRGLGFGIDLFGLATHLSNLLPQGRGFVGCGRWLALGLGLCLGQCWARQETAQKDDAAEEVHVCLYNA